MIKFIGTSSEHINEILALEKKITPLLTYLEEKIQVLQPLKVILRDEPLYTQTLQSSKYSPTEIKLILQTPVSVNRLYSYHKGDYELNDFDKLIKPQQGLAPEYRTLLLDNVNWTIIKSNLSEWRHNVVWDFDWLGPVFNNFEEIFEYAGNIGEIQGGFKLDFSSDIDLVSMVESLLQLLQRYTHFKLIGR